MTLNGKWNGRNWPGCAPLSRRANRTPRRGNAPGKTPGYGRADDENRPDEKARPDRSTGRDQGRSRGGNPHRTRRPRPRLSLGLCRRRTGPQSGLNITAPGRARTARRKTMPSNRSYFQRPGVSSHALIEIARTPLHCWAKYVNPNRQDEEPTAAMRFGTLVHTLVLAPETFGDEFVLADAINRRTADGQGAIRRLAGVRPAGRHPQGVPRGAGDRQGDPAASGGRRAVQSRRTGKSPHRAAGTAPIAAQGAAGLAESAARHRGVENRQPTRAGRASCAPSTGTAITCRPPITGCWSAGRPERPKPTSRIPLSSWNLNLRMP